jgi:hypothetical protein
MYFVIVFVLLWILMAGTGTIDKERGPWPGFGKPSILYDCRYSAMAWRSSGLLRKYFGPRDSTLCGCIPEHGQPVQDW